LKKEKERQERDRLQNKQIKKKLKYSLKFISNINDKKLASCKEEYNKLYELTNKLLLDYGVVIKDNQRLKDDIDKLKKKSKKEKEELEEKLDRQRKYEEKLRLSLKEDSVATLSKGSSLIKIPHKGKAKSTMIFLEKDKDKWILRWDSKNKSKEDASIELGKDCCITLGHVSGLFLNKDISKEFPDESVCFSIVGSKRTLDLVASDHRDLKVWLEALEYVGVKRGEGKENRSRETSVSKKEMSVSKKKITFRIYTANVRVQSVPKFFFGPLRTSVNFHLRGP